MSVVVHGVGGLRGRGRVVAHAGNVATRLLSNQVGLTGALSAAMARRGFTPTHDRGRVLVDVAVLIAGGGEAIADIDVLNHLGEILGSVASAPTVWRALDEVTPAVAKRIEPPGRRSAPTSGPSCPAGPGYCSDRDRKSLMMRMQSSRSS